jgi:hypothetical protein
MIDNNTLYAPYKPFNHTNSSSSILTSSSSTPTPFASTFNTASSQANIQQPMETKCAHNAYRPLPSSYLSSCSNVKPYFAANRRESLFYHSTDNHHHRLTYTQRQNQYFHEQQLKEQQIKFLEQQKRLQQQTHQSRIMSKSKLTNSNQNESNSDSSAPMGVNCLAPHVNSAPNQVHAMVELFNRGGGGGGDEEEVEVKMLPIATNGFDRSHINQLSTKSQPPMTSSSSDILLINNYRNMGTTGVTSGVCVEGGGISASASASTTSSTTSSTSSSLASCTSTSACLSNTSNQYYTNKNNVDSFPQSLSTNLVNQKPYHQYPYTQYHHQHINNHHQQQGQRLQPQVSSNSYQKNILPQPAQV